MAAPNPLWGIHLAPGVITAVLVHRTDDGGYEVLDELTDTAPDDDGALLTAGLRAAQRPELRGRAGMIAIPDLNGSLVTAAIPSEELYLTDDEIQRELHDFTPFEPGEGHLLYAPVGRPEDREFMVSALPVAEIRGRIAALAELDPAYHGAMTAGPAVVRGARSLGLVGETGFVVDVQRDATAVYALDARRVRRYLVATGSRAGADGDVLARDLLSTITYHRDQQRRDDDPPEESTPVGDVVLVGPEAANVRSMVAERLGTRLASVDARAESGSAVVGKDGAAVSDETALRLAPAVGAAIEAFQGRGNRIALREPPDDVPEYVENTGRSRTPLVAAALVVVLAAAGGLAFFGSGDPPSGDEAIVAKTDRPAVDVDPPPTERDAEAAAALVESLRRRGALAAALRGVAAIVRSDAQEFVGHSVDIQAAREAFRVAVVVSVPGGVTPDARRAARSAIEGVPGVRGVTLDTPGDHLRVRFAAGYARLGEASDGDPTQDARLADLESAPDFFRAAWSDLGETSGSDGASLVLRTPGNQVLAALAAMGAEAIAAPPTRLAVVVTGSGAVEIRAEFGSPPISELPLLPEESELAAAALDACRAATADLSHGAGRFGSTDTTALPAQGLSVVGTGDGWVALSFAPAAAKRTLRRRRLDSKTAEIAAVVPAEADRVRDDIPGASGEYEWSFDGDETSIRARVEVPVEISLVGADPGQPIGTSVVFRLHRSYRQTGLGTTVTGREGAALTATTDFEGTAVTLATPWTISSVRVAETTEAATVRVPEFRPDGTVLRDESGVPVMIERSVDRPVRSLEVEATDDTGKVRRWLRKMTDG